MNYQDKKPDSANPGTILHPQPKGSSDSSLPGTHPIRDQAKDVVGEVKELGAVARDAGKQKAGELVKQGDELLKDGQRKLDNAQQRVEDYVRERPVSTLLYAVGFGFLASMLLRR